MKLRLKMNVKFGSNHRLEKGFEVESDEKGVFPDYVNENRDLFEEIVGSSKSVVVESAAGPSGTTNSPAKPVAVKKDKPAVKPKAQTSTTTKKVAPEANKPATSVVSRLLRRNKG